MFDCITFYYYICLTVCFSGPRKGWTHKPDGLRMQKGTLPDGTPQAFYFADTHPTMPGWFKGMELIIRERGLWPPAGLLALCKKSSSTCVDCCCRHLLYNQPDFVAQKPLLQEVIEKCNHICDFYPKYHCELNFIEQYWGAAKWHYQNQLCVETMKNMEGNIFAALDMVPISSI
jgi:hypothetical protein